MPVPGISAGVHRVGMPRVRIAIQAETSHFFHTRWIQQVTKFPASASAFLGGPWARVKGALSGGNLDTVTLCSRRL